MNEWNAKLVLDVLVRHGHLPKRAGWFVEVAAGGSTDRTFSVRDQFGNRRMTIRLARPGLADWLRHEARILSELEGGETPADWSPRRVALIEDERLPEGLLLVHDYLSGTPGPFATTSLAGREHLGACLAWLHGHRQTSYTIWPSLASRDGTRADAYRARIDSLHAYQSSHGSLPDVDGMIEQLRSATLSPQAGWEERDFALCHGDLSIGNILWDDDAVALIDWEFARYADPAEEIAYLIAEQDLATDLVSDVADAYVRAGGDPWAFARLQVWLPLVALDAALWWADHSLTDGNRPDAVTKIAERLNRVQMLLEAGSR